MNEKNSKIGRAYEDHVEQYLAARGYEPIGRNVRHESGAELDLHMRHRATGQEIGVECKASENDAKAPGMRKSDNVWKVLGYLHAIRMWVENTGGSLDYKVATSHAPIPGTQWHDLIEAARLRKELELFEIPWNGAE